MNKIIKTRMMGLGKVLIVFLLLGGIAAISTNAAFKHFAVQESKAQGLPLSTENSIKHAYAASQCYVLLRFFGVNSSLSLEAVLLLGKVNEIAELLIKFGKSEDSTQEIYKDMHNNFAGILVAQWIEENPNSESNHLSLIGFLASQRELILASADVVLNHQKAAGFWKKFIDADQQFKETKTEIKVKVLGALSS